jgi:hypothetical protein
VSCIFLQQLQLVCKLFFNRVQSFSDSPDGGAGKRPYAFEKNAAAKKNFHPAQHRPAASFRLRIARD